jgi:ubiquinone/menaquinone biosynthesis C-methylase UbiE
MSESQFILSKFRPSIAQWFFYLAFLCAGCAALKQCAYEGLSRDDWQQPQKVIESLHIEPGQSIADLGSGSGYFTFALAEAAGPTGTVYAVDIDRDMTELVAKRARQRGARNVRVILAQANDPMLPQRSLDLIFTANTYHHMNDRVRYFSALRKTLRPSGRVAVIEFDHRSWWAGLMRHYTPRESIRREMEQAGYRLAQEFDFLDRQSFLLFEPSERDSKFNIQGSR